MKWVDTTRRSEGATPTTFELVLELHPSPPAMTSKQPCRFFNTSKGCRYGAACRFSHAACDLPQITTNRPVEPATSGQVCRYFAQGNCKRGNECRYTHNNPSSITPSSPAISLSRPTTTATQPTSNHNSGGNHGKDRLAENDGNSDAGSDPCCICHEKPPIYGLLRE